MYNIKHGYGCGIKATLLTASGEVCDLRRARYKGAVLVLPNGSTIPCADVSVDDITNTMYVRLLGDRELTTIGRYGILFNVKLANGVMYSSPIVMFADVQDDAEMEYRELNISIAVTVTYLPANVAYTGASPKISPNGTWLVYNDELNAYEDTGEPASYAGVAGNIQELHEQIEERTTTTYITEAVDVDWKTVGKNAEGKLCVIGGDTQVADFIEGYLLANGYAKLSELAKIFASIEWIEGKKYITDADIPSLVSAFTNDKGYITLDAIAPYAKKATTLGGYGITNAYTKEETESRFFAFTKIDNETIKRNEDGFMCVDFSNVPTSIFDGLPIDNETIYWDNGVLKAMGGGGGGGVADSVAWANVYGKPTWITNTKPTYNYSEIQGTPDLSVYALASAIPTNNNQLTNGAGYITSSALNGYATQSWVNTALSGYFITSNFTKANIKTTLGISDWALASSLEWGAINSKPTNIDGFGMVEYLTNLNNATLNKFFRSSFQASNRPAYNYAVGFTLGNGSISANYAAQLAIDYYGGVHTRYKASTEWSEWVELAPLSSIPTKLSQLTDDVVAGKYLLVGGTAASANKLATPRTIWGQSFDGTGNVAGTLSLYPQTQALNASSGALRFHSDSTLLSGPSIQGVHAQMGYGAKHLVFYQHNTGGYTEYEAMRLTYDGKLGIGTDAPESKLHVNGTFRITGSEGMRVVNNGYDLRFIISSTSANRGIWDNNNNAWLIYRGLDTNVVFPSGNLVIGGTTAIANVRMSMYGNAILQHDTNPFVALKKGSDSPYYVQVVSAGLKLGQGSAKSMLIDANGNVTTAGGITMYSQKSLKNILSYEGLSLEQLSVIKPIKFTWKDGRDNRYHVGGVADDMATVVPEVVYSANDFLTMDYGNAGFYVAASLIKPVIYCHNKVEEHEKDIDYLKRENVAIKKENKALRDEINQLKQAS